MRSSSLVVAVTPSPEAADSLNWRPGGSLAMQARGVAALRRAQECTAMLLQAEQALTATPDEARSPWVSHFDEGSLASEAARCFRELGEHQEAQRQAERIIQLRPGDRTRSRASGQLLLVRVLIAQGKPEEACAVAREVLDATQQLGSYLVIQQLLDLKQLLEPHRGNCNRVSADVILCDHAGRLLLVDPRYKPDWDMPCGMAEANEPPHEAVRRELTEELGLDIHVGPLLVVDWVSPRGIVKSCGLSCAD